MSRTSSTLLHVIRTMIGAYKSDGRSDAELLSRYAEAHDEAAFATLMARHGAPVWGICRSILADTQDVEEACQTTFLILAQKARKIRVTNTLVGWLHQVARQTALDARKAVLARKKLQDKMKCTAMSAEVEEVSPDETQELLHEEIVNLPEKLRTALVLHYLESKTQTEVAGILGVKRQAVCKRLARAVAILHERLTKRGLTLGSAGLGIMLAAAKSKAALPPGLIDKTVQAATAYRAGKLTGGLAKLAAEVLRNAPAAAPWWKTAWMITILCISSLGVGVAGLAWKTGFFGTKADGPPVVSKQRSLDPAPQDRQKPPRLDLYGDPLPPRALARLGTVRLRSLGDLNSLIFTADAKQIITAGESRARLWNMHTGELVHEFEPTKILALSSDGHTLIGREEGKELTLWDIARGNLIQRMPKDVVAVAPDGKTLVTLVATVGGKQLCVHNCRTGKVIWKKQFADGAGVSINGYSPDSRTLKAIISNPNCRTASTWEAVTGKMLWQCALSEDTRAIASYAHSTDGKLLAVLAKNKNNFRVAVTDTATGKEIRHWQTDEPSTSSPPLVFSPDSTLLAEGCGYGGIRILNLTSGRELRLCDANFVEIVQCLAFSPNGKTIAAGMYNEGSMWSSLRLWDVGSRHEVRLLGGGNRSGVNSVSFSADGKQIISGQFRGDITVWDSTTGKACLQFRADNKNGGPSPLARVAAISPDGNKTAFDVCEVGPTVAETGPRLVTIRDNRSWKELGRHFLPDATKDSAIFQWSFSRNGALLYCTFSGQTDHIDFWDGARGNLLHRFSGRCGRFLPDQNMFVTVVPRRDGAIVLWDAATGKEVSASPGSVEPEMRVNGESLSLKGLTLTPDGTMLVAEYASKGKPKYLALSPISLPMGKGKSSPVVGDRQIIDLSCGRLRSISPDCNTLAWTDHTDAIHLCEVATGDDRHCFPGDLGRVRTMAFSPDGRRLATGYNNTTILVWDVTGRLQHGGLRAAPLSKAALESLSVDLASTNAERAAQAIWTFAAAPRQTVPFFKNRLIPSDPDKLLALRNALEGRIAQLLQRLDDDKFQVRRQAETELKKMAQKLARRIAPALREALRAQLSPELKIRLKAILEQLQKDPKCLLSSEELYSIRAVEVLEQIGSVDAREVLQNLAAGASNASQTIASQRALYRLKYAK